MIVFEIPNMKPSSLDFRIKALASVLYGMLPLKQEIHYRADKEIYFWRYTMDSKMLLSPERRAKIYPLFVELEKLLEKCEEVPYCMQGGHAAYFNHSTYNLLIQN